MKRVLLKVSGRVQGVFYRASTQQQAQQLGVKGYVRNLPDGAVEIDVEGENDAVEKLLEWCKRGPQLANVTHIEKQEIEVLANYASFEIRK